jgi:hypothetical protein
MDRESDIHTAEAEYIARFISIIHVWLHAMVFGTGTYIFTLPS